MPARPALRLLRPLRVDIDAIERAWDDADPDTRSWLDVTSGAVKVIRADDMGAVRRLHREPGRFTPIPFDDAADLRDDMQAFIATVDDARIRRRLRDAMRAKQPARRFHGALWDEDILDDWSVFAAAKMRLRIVEWLAGLGIAAVFAE